MGTRSITRVFDGKDCILAMYRQFDGYPEGHGVELAQYLSGMTLINGITPGRNYGSAANGIQCLAAQMVGAFKEGEIGGIYLVPHTQTEEYMYEVREKGNGFTIKCIDYDGKTVFSGSPDKFLKKFDKET